VKPLNRDFGIAGLLRSALWLDSVCGLEVLSMGRPSQGRADCVLELCGTQLRILAALQGGWIWLSAASLDAGESTEAICNFPDSPAGWADLRRFVRALEISGITSLQPRPIRIGDTGPNAYVIDY
jgi:hypothetical protein